MTDEDLSASTPNKTGSPSPVEPRDNSVDDTHPSTTTYSQPFELSPMVEHTLKQLAADFESTTSSEHPQPRTAESNGDTRGGDHHGPGYTDNDTLCATCRALVEYPDGKAEGWELKLSKRSEELPEDWLYERVLTTRIAWPDTLKSMLLDDNCPLCRELTHAIPNYFGDFFNLHPLQEELTIKKSLCLWDVNNLELKLFVKCDYFDGLELQKPLDASIQLFPENILVTDNALDGRRAICDWTTSQSDVKLQSNYKVQLLSSRAIGNPGPFASNTELDISWQLVKGWMANCLANHPKCNPIRPLEPPLPTRVIDVGPTDKTCSPRLHVTAGKVTGRYATLSHRWGSKENLKLQVNNLEDFKQEIPWARLPKTFQHSIEATRRLGIRYVWIDSLCIIQDSGEDWAAESSKMTSIYENSYINLAATDAAISTQGLFFDRQPCSVRPVRLKVDSVTFYAAESHRFSRKVGGSLLYRRGWVFQERTLAPRILHCTSTQLYWECLEGIACESFPQGLPHFTESDARGFCSCKEWLRMRPPASDIYSWADGSNHASREYFESLLLWNKVVTQYQVLDLTFDKDKLVAISGLAEMHARYLKTEYLAGMWRRNLPFQILWAVVWQTPTKPKRYDKYVAPSWSYFSVQGLVRSTIEDRLDIPGEGGHHPRPIIQVVDVTIDLMDNSHPFGAVSRGALCIKGPLTNISLIRNFAFTEGTPAMTVGNKMVGAYNFDVLESFGHLKSKQPVYLLPVMLDTAKWLKGYTEGLIIQETECGGGNTTFQRVGVFSLWPETGYDNYEDGTLMLQEACLSQNGPDDEGGPFSEWGRQQVITII